MKLGFFSLSHLWERAGERASSAQERTFARAGWRNNACAAHPLTLTLSPKGEREHTRRRLLRASLVAAGVSTLAACDKLGQALGLREGFRGADLTGADYGRDFSLLDAHGQRRTLADFRGKVVQLYFGFTQCPDVCPTALVKAAEVKRLLGADGARYLVVFITVDPERDTPELLGEYIAAFDPGFVALRPATPEELKKTAADFKIYYRAVPTGSSYTMDHSAQAYLFDPQGRLRVMLRPDQTAQDYAHDAKLLLTQTAS